MVDILKLCLGIVGGTVGALGAVFDEDDVKEFRIPGQERKEFRWAIDLAICEDYVDPVISVKIVSPSVAVDTCISLGPLVTAATVNGKEIILVVENSDMGKWVRIRLPAKSYSSKLNVEWAAHNEVSVISMGFFPESWTVDNLLSGARLLGSDIIFGVLYCRKFGWDNPGDYTIPSSWRIVKMIEEAKLENAYQPIKKELVFGMYFDEAVCKRWISDLARKPSKGKSKAKVTAGPSGEKADAPRTKTQK